MKRLLSMKSLLSFGPLVLFLLLLTGLGYLIIPPQPTPIPPTTEILPIPSRSAPPTPVPPSPSASPSHPPVAVVTAPSTPTTAPTAPETLAVESTGTPTATPVPTATVSPPSPPLTGVATTQLNVRRGPGTGYGIIGAVYPGDRVTLTRRNGAGDWLQIELEDGKQGWIAAKYVEQINGVIGGLQVVIVPTLIPSPTGTGLPRVVPLAIEGASVTGLLAPGHEQLYTFTEKDKDTLFILFFRPNVNVSADDVQFSIHSTDPNSLSNPVGRGSRPSSDRDGDLNTGELVWRGGPLVPAAPYYLQVTNNSGQPVNYCLAFTEAYSWSCR